MNLKVRAYRARPTGVTDAISSEYLSTEGHRKEPPHLLLLLLFSPSHFTAGLHFSIIARATLPPSAPECCLCLPAVSFCLFLLCSLPTIKGAARIESELGLCLSSSVRFFAVTASQHFYFPSSPSHHEPCRISKVPTRSRP